jgi:hypothetical protein
MYNDPTFISHKIIRNYFKCLFNVGTRQIQKQKNISIKIKHIISKSNVNIIE